MRAKKLFLFAPERMALSMERLAHYCGTPAESFQRYVLFTNYAMHVEEFRTRFPDAEGPERSGVQMPAWHHRTPNQDGVTLVDIGVGPSNAKTVTDHLAVLRPDAMLMIGHCAGLRNHQDIGDYVLATAYLRDDHILDHALPTTIPVIPNHRMNSYLLDALDAHQARYRIGTVLTTANRNWELEIEAMEHTFEQSRAVAVDMESATIAANGFRYRIPSATLLAISDKPLHGAPKLPGPGEAVLRREPASAPRDHAGMHRSRSSRTPGGHPERRHSQPRRAALRRARRGMRRPTRGLDRFAELPRGEREHAGWARRDWHCSRRSSCSQRARPRRRRVRRSGCVDVVDLDDAHEHTASAVYATDSGACRPAAIPSRRCRDRLDADVVRRHEDPHALVPALRRQRATPKPEPTVLMGPGWGQAGDTNTQTVGLFGSLGIGTLQQGRLQRLDLGPAWVRAIDGHGRDRQRGGRGPRRAVRCSTGSRPSRGAARRRKRIRGSAWSAAPTAAASRFITAGDRLPGRRDRSDDRLALARRRVSTRQTRRRTVGRRC